MNKWKKRIQIADHVVNLLIVLCFLPILLYAGYTLWDVQHIYQSAEASLYESYKPTATNKVSIEELQKKNPEVFGWLTVNDTNIDYPLVQSSDNSKYVNTDVEGKFSLSGSIFLDYRNKKNFSDVNNIIYGHHMDKRVMFGEIEYFEKEKYFKSHQYGKIYFEREWHDIEFFAFLHADAYDSVLYNTELQMEKDMQQYVRYIKEKAKVFKELPFDKDEHFITLSTCTSDSTNGRHLLIGRIKDSAKSSGDKGD